MKKASERIKGIRLELRMDQEEFVKPLGFSQSYLSQIEKGTREVTYNIANAIRDAYRVSIEYIMKGEGRKFIEETKSSELNDTAETMMKEIEHLNEMIVQLNKRIEDKDALIDMLRGGSGSQEKPFPKQHSK